jgi:hypothetical protein
MAGQGSGETPRITRIPGTKQRQKEAQEDSQPDYISDIQEPVSTTFRPFMMIFLLR